MLKKEEDVLVFDSEDLVNRLGGALGLFLGWSLLHIFSQFVHALIIIRDRVAEMYKIKLWINYNMRFIKIKFMDDIHKVLFKSYQQDSAGGVAGSVLH